MGFSLWLRYPILGVIIIITAYIYVLLLTTGLIPERRGLEPWFPRRPSAICELHIHQIELNCIAGGAGFLNIFSFTFENLQVQPGSNWQSFTDFKPTIYILPSSYNFISLNIKGWFNRSNSHRRTAKLFVLLGWRWCVQLFVVEFTWLEFCESHAN